MGKKNDGRPWGISGQKRSSIGAGLTIVRYAPEATKFRTAAKLRDGPIGDIARLIPK